MSHILFVTRGNFDIILQSICQLIVNKQNSVVFNFINKNTICNSTTIHASNEISKWHPIKGYHNVLLTTLDTYYDTFLEIMKCENTTLILVTGCMPPLSFVKSFDVCYESNTSFKCNSLLKDPMFVHECVNKVVIYRSPPTNTLVHYLDDHLNEIDPNEVQRMELSEERKLLMERFNALMDERPYWDDLMFKKKELNVNEK